MVIFKQNCNKPVTFLGNIIYNYNNVIMITGELTSHGLNVRKQRLLEDMELSDVSDGETIAKRLSTEATTPKMSEAINKLFSSKKSFVLSCG